MLKKIHHHLRHHYHTRYHGKYTHTKQLFIFDIFLLVLAVVIFISGIVFLLRKPIVKDDIEMVVSTNVPNLKSGLPVKLTIEFTNTSKLLLHPSTLAVRLPHGFVVDRSRTPESILNTDNTITLSNPLAPGAKSQIEINGQWWADSHQPESLFATLSYYEDKNQNLDQKIISFTPHFSSSVLETHLDITTSSFPNQSIPFEYSLTNTSDVPASHITIIPEWKGRTTITSTLNDISLNAHEIKKIYGILTAPTNADIYPFQVRSEVAVQDRTLAQTMDKESVRIVYPNITSEVRLSNSLPYLEPGKEIPVTIHWRNDSTFTLTDQQLHLHFSPQGIINVPATALTNGISTDGNDLVITSAHKTTLSNGQPGAEDTFTLNLQTLPEFNLSGTGVNLEITPSMEAQALLVKEQRFNREGTKMAIPVVTNVALTRNEVRYYTPEGDQIGRGTLPPKVGETTKYWVLMQVANTTNDLKDAALEIQLAPGVTFSTSSQSVTLGPQLHYAKTTNKVHWNFSDVPANSKIGWNFLVEVTPTTEQIGKTIPLVNSGIFTATDGLVGKKFEIQIPGMDNVLKANDKGSKVGAKVKKANL